jgi:hypothetical protein
VLNLFKTQNFMPLLLPQSGIGPLQLVGLFGNNLTPLGQLTTSMTTPPGTAPPPIIQDIATGASWEGQSSAQVKLSIGLQILGNILQALTGQNLDVSTTYQNAKTMKFKFTDVSADKIELNVLDQYLGKANINPAGKQIEQMMLESKVGILSMTLKAKKFVTSGQNDSGTDIGVNVPVIQGVASGSLKVGFNNAQNTEIAYEGTVPVTFAAQGVHLFFDDQGHYTAFDPFKAGQQAVRGDQSRGRGISNFEPRMLTIEGAFARWQAADSVAKAVG